MKCMNNWQACRHGRRMNSIEWICKIYKLSVVVYNDGDSVSATIPGNCNCYCERKLSVKEARAHSDFGRPIFHGL